MDARATRLPNLQIYTVIDEGRCRGFWGPIEAHTNLARVCWGTRDLSRVPRLCASTFQGAAWSCAASQRAMSVPYVVAEVGLSKFRTAASSVTAPFREGSNSPQKRRHDGVPHAIKNPPRWSPAFEMGSR
jgi:hypothetical protein